MLRTDAIKPSGLLLRYKVTDSDGNPKASAIISNAPFVIEKKTENSWQKLPLKMQTRTWQTGLIHTDGYYERSIDWMALYGLLGNGTYRITTDVLEKGDSISAEFQITSFSDNIAQQALDKCNQAIQEVLDRDTYHIYISEESTNATSYTNWWKSGNDYLELFGRKEGEVCDGKMKKDGIKYRLDNEEENNSNTPVAGWSVWPALDDTRMTDWTVGYILSPRQVDFSDDIAVITDEQITFRLSNLQPEEDHIYTFYFDGSGRLLQIVSQYHNSNYDGFGKEHTGTRILEVFDTTPDAITQKIAEQDTNFYRNFSWAEDRENYTRLDVTFNNTTAQPIAAAPDAIARAERECSVDYTKIVVYRDEDAGIWKVEYQMDYGYRGYQYIYLNDEGITQMISGAGSKVEQWKYKFPDP